jgi:hypothetical protein
MDSRAKIYVETVKVVMIFLVAVMAGYVISMSDIVRPM